MFLPSEKVVCVDDKFPNPLLDFPCGYVVCGNIYTVLGMGNSNRGVRIAGLPVIYPLTGLDVGWKPVRFRRLHDATSDNNEEVGELVGAV